MFCEGSLGKVNDKDLELFRNKLMVYKLYRLKVLITLEEVNTAQWSRKRRMLMGKTSINSADDEANWSGIVNFHCMQMTLVSSVWFIFGDDRNGVPCSSRFFALWQLMENKAYKIISGYVVVNFFNSGNVYFSFVSTSLG